jgi:cellulose synthase/poly-beta-1,6-N-acetylglucosamine synthase-like glycosyltransferase
MISVIITSYKEPKTISRAIESFANTNYSGLPEDFEIIQVSPDQETLEAGKITAEKLKLEDKFVQIVDPGVSKPNALNLVFEKARGEILILTDGDVHIDEKAVSELLKPLKNPNIGGVTGRPVSAGSKNNFWGFTGHMFMDAAHIKRTETLGNDKFYSMSGYLFAMRKNEINIPEGVLDDVYISHFINSKKLRIAYAPEARIFVKQPSTLHDWIKQKVRSIAGFQQEEILRKFKTYTQTERTFKEDLKYLFFPLKYSRNFKEFIWAILNYPLRLYTWLAVWWLTRVKRKSSGQIWKRNLKSTK